ncbi:MAG: sodium:solute symporter family protein [Nitrospirales bacterium]
MTGWDWAILALFILYALQAGFRERATASQNLEEYFLAGRSLSGWKAGLSMAATQFAADTPLLVTGLVATAGIFALWQLWIYALAFLMMGFLLAPSWRRVGVLTDAELTEVRYGHRPAAILRAVKALYFGTIINCTVLAMVLLAATRLAEPFLLWDQWLPSGLFDVFVQGVKWAGVPFTVGGLEAENVWIRSANNLLSIGAIVSVTMVYSTTGGLRSVVATDLVQFAIGLVGSLAFAWIVVDHVGGLGALAQGIREQFSGAGGYPLTGNEILAFTPFGAKDVTIMVLLVYGFQWLLQMNADGTGYLAQRSMACRSDHDARVAAVVFTIAQVLLRSLIWLPLALGLLLVFPPPSGMVDFQFTAAREFTFVQGIAELLPSGLMGLMLVGMLAALASTVDTHLNWGASYWTNDLYRRFICEGWLKRSPSNRTLVWVARGSNVFILLIAMSILPWLPSIQTAWQMSLLLGAGMGVLLVLRWIWWRVTAWGELSCIVTSVVMAPLLLWALPGQQETRLLIMGIGAGLIGVIVSLFTGPEDSERLETFYRRAQPPGFWGPIEQRVAPEKRDSARRFWKAISAMGLTAVSLFCLLTGIGSWLVGSPAPAWVPWREVWIGGLLFLGIILCPLWIKIGFSQPEHQDQKN